MFLPIGSDAPLYHRPIATIGLILLNVALFVAQTNGELESWPLTLGAGLHPLQWWTSVFYHYDWLHLFGNLIFLWTFGLIVEGKLGAFRFVALYFSLAGLEGAITQVLMLASDPPNITAGASGLIFALMAIALVWAPRNELDVCYLVGFGLWLRTGVFQTTITAFSLCFLVLNLVIATIRGFEVSTELLHLLSASIGFALGSLLLKLDMVDCEGWDAWSLWRGRTLIEEIAGPNVLRLSRSTSDLDVVPPQAPRVPVDRRLELLRTALASQNPLSAWSSYKDLRDRGRHDQVDEQTMRKLIDAMRIGKDWGNLIWVLEDFIARFPPAADRARLILADILIRREQRPRAALRALETLDDAKLDESDRKLARRLTRLAESQIDDGVMELSTLPA